MKKLMLLAFLVIATGCTTSPAPNTNTPGASPTPGDAAAVPYSVTLTGFTISGFPGVHSAVIAGSPEKLLVFGGRRNGLHGFPGGHDAQKGPAFPKTEANDTIYVLNLVTKQLLGSAPVGTLPVAIANQLKATNLQYEMLNGWLYVMGGYGQDPKLGSLTTLGYMTAINFDALVDAVITKKPLDGNFAATNMVQFSHLALAITGGDLELLTDTTSGGTLFVLAFGQQYDGEYTPGGGLVNQNYADGVRVFTFNFGAGGKPSSINFVNSFPNPPGTQMDPNNQFHRRDLTMKASVDASGNRRLVAYGGVFKGGQFEGFLNPVFINAGSNAVTLTPNTATSQLMSQYDTAAIQLYDTTGKIMYTTFLGGISQYYWDSATNSLKRDPVDISKGIDGLPFINSISTLKMPSSNDTGTQYLHTGQTMAPSSAIPNCSSGTSTAPAPLGGTESKFVIASNVQQVTPGVLTLNSLTSATVVGYLVGGIAATTPYSANGPTCASNTFYQVTINGTQPTNTVPLQAPPG
ncbi:MAG TPA: hypothetical protein VFY67_04605 [Pyrinomonadaceae bacterium]|nr:hypothetical protein [Pyrinomonadaceae bacterium]